MHIAASIRVSTTDQSLDRQQLTWDYATDQLAVDPTEITVFIAKAPVPILSAPATRALMSAPTNRRRILSAAVGP